MGKDYERICEWGNLYDAYLKARRGKRWKNSVAKVEASALEAVALIQRELQTRTYRPGGYRAFYVYEPKRRLIQTNSFKDKIVQHAFCDQVLYDALTKPFILDNYGSQVGKGTHFGLNRLRDFMREYYRKNGFSADGWVLKQTSATTSNPSGPTCRKRTLRSICTTLTVWRLPARSLTARRTRWASLSGINRPKSSRCYI